MAQSGDVAAHPARLTMTIHDHPRTWSRWSRSSHGRLLHVYIQVIEHGGYGDVERAGRLAPRAGALGKCLGKICGSLVRQEEQARRSFSASVVLGWYCSQWTSIMRERSENNEKSCRLFINV